MMYPKFPQILTPEQLATIPWVVIVVAAFLIVVALVTWAIIRWSQVQDTLDTFSLKGKEKNETRL